jgi:hypothetical protein
MWHRAPGVISPAGHSRGQSEGPGSPEIWFGLGPCLARGGHWSTHGSSNISACKTSMASQIISSCETAYYSHLQFGSFFFGEMPNCTKVLASAANMSTLIFKGANLRTKQCCSPWRCRSWKTVDSISIRFFILKIIFRFLLDMCGVRVQAATVWVCHLKFSEFLIF